MDSTFSLRDGNSLVIHVVDAGLGIPKEIRDKIMTPFFTTKRLQGNWTWIEFVPRIVSKHHGDF